MGKHKQQDKKGRRKHEYHSHGRSYHHVSPKSSREVGEKTYHGSGSLSFMPSNDMPSMSRYPSSETSYICSDLKFPWQDYRSTLNKIFFRDQDLVKRGTEEYDEFWTFLKKYQNIQQKASEKGTPTFTHANHGPGGNVHKESSSSLGLPDSYSKCYKINFSIVNDNMKDLLMRGHLFKDDVDSSLTEERLREFRYILHLYLDFLQKQKFSKLRKLRESQANLPIYNFRQQIVSSVQKHQVVVVAGDTGCGKSTQVPQYLLSSGFDSIACTQPRRIACISLCKRVAYETLNEYGTNVGYQIRFEKSKTSHTKILFLTEGLLLRQVSTDPMLSNYKVVILDEVHERHLPCDFLLGIVKCLTIQRPDLKIVLMSATINIQLFSEYFSGCPVIQVPGRLFPIQVHHCPIPVEEQKTLSGKLNPAPYVRIMNMIDHKYSRSERGDLLIFVSGLTEISIIEEAAKQYAEHTKSWIILPLHSTLSLDQQDKVFDIAPDSVRKCIISTNIAETSVTIDGVRFVVDSGKVKEMSYDPNCHLKRLQEFWISRASAEQRKGRAGRTGPGVCFRMYSQEDYHALAAYAKPEIQRVPLDSLLLQMISMGLPDARKFPFLEPPSMTSIEESLQSLKDQGALSNDEALTPMGQMLARLPVEVTIGKMLIHGSLFSLTEAVLSAAAALSVQSPFTNQSVRDPDILASRQLLESDHGDPFTLLSTYHKWLEVKADPRVNSRKWCKRRGLEEQRFYEMTKLRKQFNDLLKDAGFLRKEEVFSSSSDRARRYGELKQLKNMKRQFHQAPRKRKLLQLETGFEGFAEGESEPEEEGIDIKDVEFRMSNDRKQVYNLSSASQVTTYRDMVCLKLIICSGLFPRLAISDIHNSFKSDSEQLFHTKGKPYVVLHPNGIFALQPDLLQLKESDIVERKSASQTFFSTKHQLVTFMSLLETTKPYLVNCMRVPTCHMLLLLSHSLDTNQDFTRVICDGWLELRFADAEVAQEMCSKAMNIRDVWQELLKKAFQEFSLNCERRSSEIHKMGQKLQTKITDYFAMEAIHSARRLLAADLKNLYAGPEGGHYFINFSDCLAVLQILGLKDHQFVGDHVMSSSSLPISFLTEAENCSEDPVKGGLKVKDYLTYNCLIDPDEAYLQYIQKHWTCPICGQEMVATVLDQIRHKEKCQPPNDDKEDSEKVEENRSNSLKKMYFCPDCQDQLYLTATEILRHKHTHAKS